MKTLAAVLVETGRPLELAELEIPVLKPGQVLVELAFSGVCHTQVGEWRGWRGPDAFLPHCLGHEGSGQVLEVGAGVTRCRPGERIVLSWIKGAGQDIPGTVYRWGARTVNAGGVTTFARHAVVSENRVSPLPAGLTLPAAAMLGCAVATGFGSVVHAARLGPGESIAIFGTGGIGLCAVAAAAASGAARIVAIDRLASRLDLARELGASHRVDVSTTDPVAELRRIVPGGWDAAIEATGRPEIMQAALASVRPRGGRAVVVGNARFGESLVLDPRELNQGKKLLGTWGGDTDPDRDFPRYAAWIAGGQAPIARLLDREYPLAGIQQALEDLESGQATRPLINMTL